MSSSTEYPSIVSNTLAPVSAAIDVIAQAFSRTVTIAFALICFAGSVIMVIKRKIGETDKAIFLAGALYSGLGVALYTLGSRALAIVFIPISMGVLYVYQRKFRPYLKCFFLFLLVLVVSISIHTSFVSFPITFQTREAQTTANFLIDKYNWNSSAFTGTVISDLGARWYIDAQIQEYTELYTVESSGFLTSNTTNFDCIIYSVGLAMSLKMNNVSVEEMSHHILNRYNVVYNSGLSYIAEKSG
jgi:hypothetical protein